MNIDDQESRKKLVVNSRNMRSICHSVTNINPKFEFKSNKDNTETDYKLAKSLVINIKYGLGSYWDDEINQNDSINKKTNDSELK